MGPPSWQAKYARPTISAPYYPSSPTQFFYHPSSSNSSLDSASVDTEDLSDAEWAQHHFAALAQASSASEFNERAAKAFSRQVNVTVNGMHLSRELYARQWGASAAGVDGDGDARVKGAIAFVGAPIGTQAMRIPMHQSAVLIGLQYEAVFSNSDSDYSDTTEDGVESRPFKISISSSVNLTIAEDKSLSSETPDRRRIFSINQIIVDRNGTTIFPIRD